MKKAALCLILILFVAALALGAPITPPPRNPQGLKIISVEVKNDSITPDSEVKRLITTRVGDLYDSRAVDSQLNLLSRLAGVKNVVVSFSEEEGGIRLSYEVIAEPLIRKITFEGVTALDTDRVAARLSTKVDDPVYLPFVEADRKEIERLYAQIGYFEAKVSTVVEPTQYKNWVAAKFTVDEGRRAVITGYGDMGESEKVGLGRVLGWLGMKKGSPASATALREGVEKLMAQIHRHDYPEAVMNGAALVESGEGRDLVLPLSLGLHTVISLQADDGLSKAEFYDILKMRFGEAITEQWLAQMQKALAEALYEKGYALAEVKYSDEVGEATRKIVFTVKAGPETVLKEVRFTGNARVDSESLRKRLTALDSGFFSDPPYIRGELEKALSALEGFYASMGMVTAKAEIGEVSISADGDAVAEIRVEEGDIYRFGALSFETDGSISPEEALLASELVEGDSAAPGKIDRARVALTAELSRRGHLGGQVKVKTSIDAANKRVGTTFSITGGPKSRFGTVVVSGNARTLPHVILRELTFKSGEAWNPEEILISQRKLFRLGFFQDVRIEALPADREGESVPVVVKVRERNTGHLDYGFGYGTEEGPMAFIEMGHSNVVGTGRSLLLRMEARGKDTSASINYKMPWIFEEPYDLRLSFITQHLVKESYSLESMAVQTWLDHEFDRFTKGSVLYTVERNLLTDVAPGVTVTDEGANDYFLSAIGPILIRDTRDDQFNPKSGARHTAEVQVAAPFLWSDIGFVRYQASTSGFFGVGPFTVALLARGGYAETIGNTTELPIDKRFFLGGRSTVRGFERDSIGPLGSDGSPAGGDLMVNLKAEARFIITGKVGGTVFWDAGQVWLSREESVDPINDLRNAAGFGFRYITPVGPISLDIGFKLDRKEGESPSEWNFTIGNVF